MNKIQILCKFLRQSRSLILVLYRKLQEQNRLKVASVYIYMTSSVGREGVRGSGREMLPALCIWGVLFRVARGQWLALRLPRRILCILCPVCKVLANPESNQEVSLRQRQKLFRNSNHVTKYMMVGQRACVWVQGRMGGGGGRATQHVFIIMFSLCVQHTHTHRCSTCWASVCVCMHANYNSKGRSSSSSSSIGLQAPPTLKLQLSALNLRSALAPHSQRESEREKERTRECGRAGARVTLSLASIRFSLSLSQSQSQSQSLPASLFK